MEYNGLLDSHLKYGTTKEDIISHMKEEASRRLKNSYLLNEIIKEEKIELTKEEVEKEIAEIAKANNVTEKDVEEAYGGFEAISYDLKVKKAIDLMKAEEK